MPPSKTDTYRVILLKKSYGASERLFFRRQPAHPKIKKQNADPYKKDQAAYPQKKTEKKERQTLKPKPYFPIKIHTHSNLRFFAATPYTHKSD